MMKRIILVLATAAVMVALIASTAVAAKPQFCSDDNNPVTQECYNTMQDCRAFQQTTFGAAKCEPSR
jgi:hypothetical protein